MTERRPYVGIVALAAVVVALSAGCAPVGATAPSQASVDEAHLPSTGELLNAFSGFSADFDVARSPDELAEWSEVVVGGTLDAVQDGREFRTVDGSSSSRSIVLVVTPDSVSKGWFSESSDGKLYVEIVSPGNRPASHYTGLFPAGTDIAFFGETAWSGEKADGNEIEVKDAGAGRPSGQRLYIPVSPQGLIVQLPGSRELVWPLGGNSAEASIDETLPGGSVVLEG